jgi:hypothetical protein
MLQPTQAIQACQTIYNDAIFPAAQKADIMAAILGFGVAVTGSAGKAAPVRTRVARASAKSGSTTTTTKTAQTPRARGRPPGATTTNRRSTARRGAPKQPSEFQSQLLACLPKDGTGISQTQINLKLPRVAKNKIGAGLKGMLKPQWVRTQGDTFATRTWYLNLETAQALRAA